MRTLQQMKKLATMVELDNGECYLEIGPKSGDYATADMYLLQPRYETYYFENSRIGHMIKSVKWCQLGTCIVVILGNNDRISGLHCFQRRKL